jgi:hypothetical protein
MWAPSFTCQACLEDQERCLLCTVQIKRNYNTELAVLRRRVRAKVETDGPEADLAGNAHGL